jgi:hypothetical protein
LWKPRFLLRPRFCAPSHQAAASQVKRQKALAAQAQSSNIGISRSLFFAAHPVHFGKKTVQFAHGLAEFVRVCGNHVLPCAVQDAGKNEGRDPGAAAKIRAAHPCAVQKIFCFVVNAWLRLHVEIITNGFEKINLKIHLYIVRIAAFWYGVYYENFYGMYD